MKPIVLDSNRNSVQFQQLERLKLDDFSEQPMFEGIPCNQFADKKASKSPKKDKSPTKIDKKNKKDKKSKKQK